ncbi:transposase [Mesorhizobium sp. INR15]|uniref:IS66-like element accessory protein TnpA n=1 Tax=Mesorhizobium sp. INR15 TaxID=2654248 RepID=UPI0018964CF3|nr:transposase [Mesorhizobium sp. INR15]QPC95510.1 transposase [Mesorhizobium sp. INR15]
MQSAPKSRLDTFAVIEAVASRLDESPPLLRRRWSAEAKARILEAALAPGANVSAVARTHDVSPQQVFAWRRKAIRSGELVVLTRGSEPVAQSFAPVEVTREHGARAVGLEIVIGDATIRVGSDVAPALLTEAIRAVRSA